MSDNLNATFNNAEAIVGIVVALPEELSTLTSSKLRQGECRRFGNNWIAYGGAGPINAAKAARTLLEKGAQRLMSWGCAAGLSSQLKPGDLLIPTRIIAADHNYAADGNWTADTIRSLSPILPVHEGHLFTSDTLISHSREKQRIHQQSQAMALDMESTAIAEVASQALVPFLAIRVIADPVEMNLPQAVQHALNADGRVELPKLLRYLLLHPAEISGLIRLGLHFHAARKTLKLVARQLSLPEPHKHQ